MKKLVMILFVCLIFGNVAHAETLKNPFVCWSEDACVNASLKKAQDPNLTWEGLASPSGAPCFITSANVKVTAVKERKGTACKITILTVMPGSGSVYGSDVFTPCDNLSPDLVGPRQ